MAKRQWANIPFHPGKWPFFYGWMILLLAATGILMSIPGQTIGVSVFTDPLLDTLLISRDELSLAYMLGTIGSSFLLPWAGRVYDRVGVRPVAITASLGLGFILFILSNIEYILFDLFKIESNLIIIFWMFGAFLLLRFCGQGVLTMSSRNMMMQWFDRRRGFATGISNVFVSLTFASSPLFLHHLIQRYTWEGAWTAMAFFLVLVFPLVIFIFFRNTPEASGLVPDGKVKASKKQKKVLFPTVKEFTLAEVRRSYSFWIFAFMLSMQGLYITGFTFHVISIFNESGLSESQAISIFQPSAVLAVIFTLVGSNASDYIPLKFLYYVKGIGACTAILGLIFLGEWGPAYYILIIGNGIMMGLFSVLATVSWPRYFGRLHLGAINGQAMMLIVFGSALGPILFSKSLSAFGAYDSAGWICFSIYFLLTVLAVKADNPQKKLAEEGKM
jgi:OFA family oxalate/formate antiporter-like MFS transporter